MSILDAMREDVRVILERDPAAVNTLEVLLAYPGLHAVWLHRLAHSLWRAQVPVIPRLVSHANRFLTGIEIHPGATLGRRIFIDHGMGVVIGETAVVGDDVLMYQGVTLGGTGKERGKRHPTVGSNVVIGVGAQVLGAITIGDHVRIGAGSVVVKDVPAYSTVVGVPGRVVVVYDPETGRTEKLPDPEAEMLNCLRDELLKLEAQVSQLQAASLPPGALKELPPSPCLEDAVPTPGASLLAAAE